MIYRIWPSHRRQARRELKQLPQANSRGDRVVQRVSFALLIIQAQRQPVDWNWGLGAAGLRPSFTLVSRLASWERIDWTTTGATAPMSPVSYMPTSDMVIRGAKENAGSVAGSADWLLLSGDGRKTFGRAGEDENCIPRSALAGGRLMDATRISSCSSSLLPKVSLDRLSIMSRELTPPCVVPSHPPCLPVQPHHRPQPLPPGQADPAKPPQALGCVL